MRQPDASKPKAFKAGKHTSFGMPCSKQTTQVQAFQVFYDRRDFRRQLPINGARIPSMELSFAPTEPWEKIGCTAKTLTWTAE